MKCPSCDVEGIDDGGDWRCEKCGRLLDKNGQERPLVPFKETYLCDLCHQETEIKETTHSSYFPLKLYLFGSEGIRVCVPCRVILADLASGMRSACSRAELNGFKRGLKKGKRD